MKRLALGPLPLVAAVIVAYIFWPRGGRIPDRRADPELAALRAKAERGRQEGRQFLRSFQPKVKGNILDLATDARAVLSELPYVVRVERHGPSAAPAQRIIHLRYTPVTDWEDFAATVPKGLKESERDRLYEKHQLEVAIDHGSVGIPLACLVRYHWLDQVLVDDLTDQDLPWWEKEVKALGVKPLAEMTREEKDDLGTRLQHLGPVASLAVAGLVRAIPAEEREAYLAAEPQGGKVNEGALRRRQEAIVRRCLASGKVSVL
jgi:hypothetical protein